MIQFWGRLLGKDETRRSIEAEEEIDVPDEYFREHVRAERGAVAFVEVAVGDFGPWVLWRVECVNQRPLLLVTIRCTEEEAKAELQAERSNP